MRSATPNDGFDGFKHNEKIQPKGHVLDVVEIELKLLSALGQSGSVAVTDLSPSGKAGADHVAEIEVGDLLGEPGNKLRALRARANEAHIASQNVP